MNDATLSHGIDLSRTERPVTVSGKTDAAPDMIKVRDLDLFYGDAQALKKIRMDMKQNRVTAFIGPSGCGKSTLLRCFNRMKLGGFLPRSGPDRNRRPGYL